MKTSFIAFGVALILMGLGAFGVIQTDELKHHKKILEEKDVEITALNQLIDDEMERSTELENRNQVLEDSIVELNIIIYDLKLQLEKKNKRISYLEGKIKRRNIAIQDLKDQITGLYRKQSLDKGTIEKLEQDIILLKKEREVAQQQQHEVIAEKKATQAEIRDYQDNVNEMQVLTDISENTTVSFTNITGRKFKNGRKIKKMRKNMNGWQYTDISFKLSHPNHLALLDKQFLLKVYDLDNEMVLTYLEENPQFPNRNLKGIPFKFDGNTIELTYCNMQKKKSENYEIRVFLIHGTEEIALDKGIFPFIKNGKFISM